jgi:hypothetical protein
MMGEAIEVDEMPKTNGVAHTPLQLFTPPPPPAKRTLMHADGSTVEDRQLTAILDAKARGYEGDSCGECGSLTLVRNGSCLKCISCGGTSGCS